MRLLSHVAISSLALLTAFTVTPAARANDWQFQLLMPRIYLPLERERFRDDDDFNSFDERESDAVFSRRRGDFVYNERLDEWVPRKRVRHLYVYDDDLEEWVPRKHKRLRNKGTMVYDETLDDWVPLYQPPEKSVKVKKPKAVKTAKKPRSVDSSTSKKKVIETVEADSGTAKSTITITDATVKKPVDKTASQVATLSKPVVKPETKTATQTAAVAKSTGQKIGCTNGADIITGYGFTSVKPKACSGTSYSYDAKRAQNGYVITLSSATGEITDVKKVN